MKCSPICSCSPARHATSTSRARFSHRALLAPLAEGRDTLDGLHANTQIPKVIGFSASRFDRGRDRTDVRARSELLLGDGGEAALVRHGRPWRRRTFLPAQRIRAAPRLRQDHGDLLHAQHAATDALAVRTRIMRSRYFDYFERALFNGILASQDPDIRHEHLLPVDARRLREALPHALRFVLVLHRIGHRESRALRRIDLRARWRRAVRQSVHGLDARLARAQAHRSCRRRAFRTRTGRD